VYSTNSINTVIILHIFSLYSFPPEFKLYHYFQTITIKPLVLLTLLGEEYYGQLAVLQIRKNLSETHWDLPKVKLRGISKRSHSRSPKNELSGISKSSPLGI